MRLFVIENGLRNSSGHHLNNCLALRDAAHEMGLNPLFLVHVDADQSVVGALKAIPCLSITPYQSVSKDPLCGLIESYLMQSRKLADELAATLARKVEPGDLIMLPTASHHELGALGLLLSRMRSIRSANLACNFVLQNFLSKDSTELNATAALYRLAMNQVLRGTDKRRVLLTANGKAMAATLESILNCTVHRYPIPKQYPDLLASGAPRTGSRPVIGVLGHMRDESKGLHLVPDLVDQCPDVDWIVQEPPAGRKELWRGREPDLRMKGNVTLVPENLDTGSYYSTFSAADIILTPYPVGADRLQSSGILAEAAASGKVIVAPANPWALEHLEDDELVGRLYTHWNAREIGLAIWDVLVNLEVLKDAAANRASGWRSTQSAGAYLSLAVSHFSRQHDDNQHANNRGVRRWKAWLAARLEL